MNARVAQDLADGISSPSQSTLKLAISAITGQHGSFTLLSAIVAALLWGGYELIPRAITEIQAGYKEARSELKSIQAEYVKTSTDQLKMVLEHNSQQNAKEREHTNELVRAIQQLQIEVRRSHVPVKREGGTQ